MDINSQKICVTKWQSLSEKQPLQSFWWGSHLEIRDIENRQKYWWFEVFCVTSAQLKRAIYISRRTIHPRYGWFEVFCALESSIFLNINHKVFLFSKNSKGKGTDLELLVRRIWEFRPGGSRQISRLLCIRPANEGYTYQETVLDLIR